TVPPMQQLLDQLQRDTPHAHHRLQQLLAIPSVSTDPAYAAQVGEAAAWVAAYCEELGLSVEVLRPGVDDRGAAAGHPIVLATTMPAGVEPGATNRVLFYGHYDVQPPDPVDKWTTPPFEPTVRDAPGSGG